jgi:hypothetical protein
MARVRQKFTPVREHVGWEQVFLAALATREAFGGFGHGLALGSKVGHPSPSARPIHRFEVGQRHPNATVTLAGRRNSATFGTGASQG